MDREFSDSKFDYHKFLYEQLTAQISSIQAIVRHIKLPILKQCWKMNWFAMRFY